MLRPSAAPRWRTTSSLRRVDGDASAWRPASTRDPTSVLKRNSRRSSFIFWASASPMGRMNACFADTAGAHGRAPLLSLEIRAAQHERQDRFALVQRFRTVDPVANLGSTERLLPELVHWSLGSARSGADLIERLANC